MITLSPFKGSASQTFDFSVLGPLQSCGRHMWPFWQLIRGIRRLGMTNKRTKTKTFLRCFLHSLCYHVRVLFWHCKVLLKFAKAVFLCLLEQVRSLGRAKDLGWARRQASGSKIFLTEKKEIEKTKWTPLTNNLQRGSMRQSRMYHCVKIVSLCKSSNFKFLKLPNAKTQAGGYLEQITNGRN